MNNNAKEKQLAQMWEDRIAQQEEESRKKITQAHRICENLQRDKETRLAAGGREPPRRLRMRPRFLTASPCGHIAGIPVSH
jgi:hypothetical protein